MRTIAFKTLGCRLNQYETDALASKFQINKYKLVDFDEEADVYVINTCTVTHQSDHKSRNFINQITKKNQDSILVVTGCMADNAKEELENKDGVDYVIKNDNKSALFSLIEAHFNGEMKQPFQLENDRFAYGSTEKGFHTRSMIKIQDGCDNFCTFCIIPSVRGRAKSRPFQAIINNIKLVIKNGAKEVIITGVNIGRYEYENYKFDDLIEAILNLEGDFRLRISSLEPDGFGDKFLNLLSHPKMTPHLHLCLQSGSDEVLLKMRRMYSIDIFKNTIEKVRAIRPDFNFTTDIIVGFPGESETDFTDSCNMIKSMRFGHVHAFKYSIRKGTRAERMENQVPEKLKTQRSEILRGIAEDNKLKYRSQFIGKTQRVLVESINGNVAKGYGEHYIPVQFEAENLKQNTLYNVVIEQIVPEKDALLLGKLL